MSTTSTSTRTSAKRRYERNTPVQFEPVETLPPRAHRNRYTTAKAKGRRPYTPPWLAAFAKAAHDHPGQWLRVKRKYRSNGIGSGIAKRYTPRELARVGVGRVESATRNGAVYFRAFRTPGRPRREA